MWNGYDLTTRRGRELLYLFCSAKRPRYVWFSSPCRASGVSLQRVSYPGWNRSRGSESASTWLSCSFCATTQCIQLDREFAAGYVREDDESSCQRLFLGFARLTRKSVVSILASFHQFSNVQRVLNHRICVKKHKHGRLSDLSNASSAQFPQLLCQTLAKQFLVKDSWHCVLGVLEHLHSNDDERPLRPLIPFASSHETSIEMENKHNVRNGN